MSLMSLLLLMTKWIATGLLFHYASELRQLHCHIKLLLLLQQSLWRFPPTINIGMRIARDMHSALRIGSKPLKYIATDIGCIWHYRIWNNSLCHPCTGAGMHAWFSERIAQMDVCMRSYVYTIYLVISISLIYIMQVCHHFMHIIATSL